MGGIYLTRRKVNNTNYIGMDAKLTLPTSISSDDTRKIKPEFFFGVYKRNLNLTVPNVTTSNPNDFETISELGMDIGVVYQNSSFRLFYWSLPYTTPRYGASSNSDQGKDISLSGVSVGDQITLRVYLNGNKITCQAKKNNNIIATLDCPLSTYSLNAFSNGIEFSREMTIAADPDYIVNPCNVYYYDTYFSEGNLTTSSGTNEKVSDSNTVITGIELDLVNNVPNVNIATLRTKNNEWGTDINNYAYERSACDMNALTN